MPKLVNLKIDSGNFQSGFKITLQIVTEGKQPFKAIYGKLPPNSEIREKYHNWQSDFLALDKRLRGRRGNSKVIDNCKK